MATYWRLEIRGAEMHEDGPIHKYGIIDSDITEIDEVAYARAKKAAYVDQLYQSEDAARLARYRWILHEIGGLDFSQEQRQEYVILCRKEKQGVL